MKEWRIPIIITSCRPSMSGRQSPNRSLPCQETTYNVINWFACIIIIGPEPLSGVPPAPILWLRIIVLLPQKTKEGSVRDEREEVVCFKIPSSYVCYSDLQEPGLDFEWHLLAQRRPSNIDDIVILLSGGCDAARADDADCEGEDRDLSGLGCTVTSRGGSGVDIVAVGKINKLQTHLIGSRPFITCSLLFGHDSQILVSFRIRFFLALSCELARHNTWLMMAT